MSKCITIPQFETEPTRQESSELQREHAAPGPLAQRLTPAAASRAAPAARGARCSSQPPPMPERRRQRSTGRKRGRCRAAGAAHGCGDAARQSANEADGQSIADEPSSSGGRRVIKLGTAGQKTDIASAKAKAARSARFGTRASPSTAPSTATTSANVVDKNAVKPAPKSLG